MSRTHILVFPFPAQGHMLPHLHLTHQLAAANLFITVLITPKNLPAVSNLLAAYPTTLILRLPPHPAIPSGIENVKDLPFNAFMPMMVALGHLYNPLINWFRNHSNPPVAIISDFLLGWTNRLARELGIRRYTFSPCGALGLSVMYSVWKNQPKRVNCQDENEVVKFPEIPNSPEFLWWQVSQFYRSYVQGDPESEFIMDGLLENLASWGLVINSFTDLEPAYVDHLKKELGHDRVFVVGLLLPSGVKETNQGGASSIEVLWWLDTCADNTVVYVCFGSQQVLTNDQMEVVAVGLEKSRVKFVWSVNEPMIGHVVS